MEVGADADDLDPSVFGFRVLAAAMAVEEEMAADRVYVREEFFGESLIDDRNGLRGCGVAGFEASSGDHRDAHDGDEVLADVGEECRVAFVRVLPLVRVGPLGDGRWSWSALSERRAISERAMPSTPGDGREALLDLLVEGNVLPGDVAAVGWIDAKRRRWSVRKPGEGG